MTFPNQLTILRILLSPVVVMMLLMDFPYHNQIAISIFLLASITDWYDGWYARRYGYISEWGKFLDPLADKILIVSSLAAFVILKYVKLWVFMVIVLRDIIVTLLRMYGASRKKPLTTSNLAKWKTFSQIGMVFFVLLYINFENSNGGGLPDQMVWGLITVQDLLEKTILLVTAFSALTGLQYMYDNRRLLKDILWRFYRIFIP